MQFVANYNAGSYVAAVSLNDKVDNFRGVSGKYKLVCCDLEKWTWPVFYLLTWLPTVCPGPDCGRRDGVAVGGVGAGHGQPRVYQEVVGGCAVHRLWFQAPACG